MNNPVNNSDSSGNLTIPNWAKIVIGIAGLATSALLIVSSGSVVLSGIIVKSLVKGAITSGLTSSAVSATISIAVSLVTGDNFKSALNKTIDSAVSGFCNGFMWGGISAFSSRLLSYVSDKTQVLGRTVDYSKEDVFMYGNNGFTIWRHGKDLRIDCSVLHGLHYHFRPLKGGIKNHHTEIVDSLIGFFAGIFTSLHD